jgi:hypothetical protein
LNREREDLPASVFFQQLISERAERELIFTSKSRAQSGQSGEGDFCKIKDQNSISLAEKKFLNTKS